MSLKRLGHKICLACTGVRQCPPDCLQKGHTWCGCFPDAEAVEEVPAEPRENLYSLHRDLTEQALEIMKAKNADYSSADDPYRNFREFGQLGILVRLSDKLARLRTFSERGELSVKDESVRDTVLDAINYLILFEGFRQK